MRPSILALTLLAATGNAASAFVLPPRPQQQQLTPRVQHGWHLQRPAMHKLWARAQGDDGPGDNDLERLMNQLLKGGVRWLREPAPARAPGCACRGSAHSHTHTHLDGFSQNPKQGERLDVEAWERRRRLETEREQEEQGLPGFVKAFVGQRLLANLPILALVPFVMLAAVQLSGIAIATAVIAALVVASFSLPVVALALVVPIVSGNTAAIFDQGIKSRSCVRLSTHPHPCIHTLQGIFLILGTLALPIIPFAVFTIAPSLAILPLFLFLGWLFLQLATGPTLIREDSLLNSLPLDEWLHVDAQDEDGSAGAGRKGRPAGREDDGVIDVEAEEDTDAEAEEQLRRFDERLQQRRGENGDGQWR